MSRNKKSIGYIFVCIGSLIAILLNIREYVIEHSLLTLSTIVVLIVVFIANIFYFKYYNK